MKGVLHLHNDDDLKTMIESEINLLTCVDDGGVMFDNRESLTKGSRIICELMAKWGLTVHVGCSGKKSETELMLVLSTTTIAQWREGLPTIIDKVKGHGARGLEYQKNKNCESY